MITASMATLGRESLVSTVQSIVHQVDRLEIHYNGVKAHGFNDRRIIEIEHELNQGDQAKFFCDVIGTHHFTIDDDIIYPNDYVSTTVKYLESYKVVSAHGVRFTGQTDSYYKGVNRIKFHYMNPVQEVEQVHVVGTGVLAFRGVKPRKRWFKEKNMADLWFSLAMERKGIPRYVIPHKAGWFKNGNIDFTQTIYEWSRGNDTIQTEIANTIYESSSLHSSMEKT